MRSILCGVLAAAALALAPQAVADPVEPVTPQPIPAPPYIDHTRWTQWNGRSSLQVYPTLAGRHASGLGMTPQGDEAWSEVLTLVSDADTPGMRSQFMCHWYFAEAAAPGKTSWNLEPWRPVVDDAAMLKAHCNPGGAEEPF
ncbi:DUF2599 domain-containing protein [Mycobacterium sp. CBMA293]|uniref:DUF2599 domain-containing protein n=1 Tax=unclassified Mycolicibacterium TaxID=2636767 RepID=UPI00132A01CB|nr:DUF2599 domain-containing protein [Mycolicibacterium sp. CBMA 360]MUL59908.1 DUF2599 domain-containing protein [Mycolicibacterium sp. CBMA 335]MUL68751.1 DUF2599 domain-containing protein [Mycolicibacterium sp. CBMA 311]MUL93858.1 DUF2599 domain-containing protein [Mycolicibacterium sp. CBMA 230]MUM06102.1 hypothetical protein [Mycolicibacterium sp. CBMA 213]MUM12882.1 DUF2599 domain-containing protein [Mycolicibacterium sp. CBMA 293]MUM32932.1 DUF2599 domain-containing protein [Mycoliciba